MNDKAENLAILDVFKKYSDIDHPLTCFKISEILQKEYGIYYERKSVLNAIRLMNAVDEDQDIILKKGNSGFYLEKRFIDEATLNCLISILKNTSLSSSEVGLIVNILMKDYSNTMKQKICKNYDIGYKEDEEIEENLIKNYNYDLRSNIFQTIKDKQNLISVSSPLFKNKEEIIYPINIYYSNNVEYVEYLRNNGDFLEEKNIPLTKIKSVRPKDIDKFGRTASYYESKIRRKGTNKFPSPYGDSYGSSSSFMCYVTTNPVEEKIDTSKLKVYIEDGLSYYTYSNSSLTKKDSDAAIDILKEYISKDERVMNSEYKFIESFDNPKEVVSAFNYLINELKIKDENLKNAYKVFFSYWLLTLFNNQEFLESCDSPSFWSMIAKYFCKGFSDNPTYFGLIRKILFNELSYENEENNIPQEILNYEKDFSKERKHTLTKFKKLFIDMDDWIKFTNITMKLKNPTYRLFALDYYQASYARAFVTLKEYDLISNLYNSLYEEYGNEVKTFSTNDHKLINNPLRVILLSFYKNIYKGDDEEILSKPTKDIFEAIKKYLIINETFKK